MTILQNFVKLACLEVAFLKIGFFGILICNLQTSQLCQNVFGFRASSLSLTSGKNFMFICPVVSEILGGWHHPPYASSLAKRADAILRVHQVCGRICILMYRLEIHLQSKLILGTYNIYYIFTASTILLYFTLH